MKNIRKILILLAAVLIMSCLGVTVMASSVTYQGGADAFVFLPGSRFTDTDLFENFKNVMPGDTLTQTITVRNSCRDADYIKVYLRAIPHDEENPLSPSVDAIEEDIASMEDFLAQLSLKVYQGSVEDANLIYSGSPDETDGLSENVNLGRYKYGEETMLIAVLEVPITLGNEYANRAGEVDWQFTVERFDNPIDYPTVPDYEKITAKKLWKDTGAIRPDFVIAQLLRDGVVYDEEILSDANNWTFTWDKLDRKYDWDIIEKEVPDGYRVSYYTAGGMVIITNIELDKELTVEKVWVDDGADFRTDYVTAQLLRDGKVEDEAVLNDGNDWTYTWEGLDAGSVWTVREKKVPDGYTVTYDYDLEDDRVYMINTWDEDAEPESWTVQKVWNGIALESVSVDLIADDTVVDTVVLSDENNWTYTWEDLDGSVSWSIVEEVPEGYTASYNVSGRLVTITNTKIGPSDITVNKVWADYDSSERPDHVTVQLFNGETAVEAVQLGEWNNWTYTWEGLDASGYWYVEETNIPMGYTPSYEKDGNIVTITNTATLIQTGQLKWPVPVLCGCGVLLVIGGIFFMTRKKKENNA